MKKSIHIVCLIFLVSLLIKADTSHSATGTESVSGTVTDYVAGLSANGIMTSRHNLGVSGRVLHTDATTQVCVFCHTPHHANSGTNAPLWNKSIANSASYIAYGSTIAGTTVNKADLGGVTLACLSCHDGVSTFDSIVNAPGKGGVVTGGFDRNWTFSMPIFATGVNVKSALFDHFETAGGPCLGCHTDSGTGLDIIKSLDLGTDLSNDHPVSVPYSASSKASLRPRSTIIAAIDLSSGLTGTTGDTGAYLTNNLSQNRWAVSGFISSTATIGSLLRENKVECSSCHDPHFRNLSWNEAEITWISWVWSFGTGLPSPAWCGGVAEDCSDGLFLRRVGGNTGSGVCRTCHDK